MNVSRIMPSKSPWVKRIGLRPHLPRICREKILADRMKKVAIKRALGPLAVVWFMVTADTFQEAAEEFIDGLVWGVDEVQ